MRHLKKGRKLNRNSSHRKAMLRNMMTSFFKYERIETTEAKAKELRRFAEKLITRSKEDTVHARRMVFRYIKDKDVLFKLFSDIGQRYKERPGGYTRIMKLGNRRGDCAPMSIIELVEDSKADVTVKDAGVE